MLELLDSKRRAAFRFPLCAATPMQGFTLIELSIVLVIIGLIVGGILVGQDMIKASEIRATVGQIEKYNSAVNTFRSKYNGIPGDLLQANAAAFGLFQMTVSPALGFGDGNGLLEGGATGATVGMGETLAFWRHLSDANLIDGSLGTGSNGLIVAGTGLPTGDVSVMGQSLPPSKTTPAGYFIVYSVTGINYYQLGPVNQIASADGSYSWGTSGLTPVQAYNMDVKLDDGMPNSGSVRAKGIAAVNANASFNATSASSTCLMTGANATDTADTYNRVTATGGNDTSCSLRFRFN